MSINLLQVYSEFYLYGKIHKVVALNPPYVWIKRHDGEDQQIRFTDLVSHPTFKAGTSMRIKKKDVVMYDALAKLPEKKREEVSERYEIIKPLILLEESKNKNMRSTQKLFDQFKSLLREDEDVNSLTQETLIQRINEIRIIQKKQKVSRATIMRYLKLYRNEENQNDSRGVEGLISRKGRGYIGRQDKKELEICHPNKPDIVLDVLVVRQNDAVIEIMKSIIENEYLTKYKVSKATIARSINRECTHRKIPGVSYSTVSQILDRIDERAKERYRNLKHAKAVYDDVARGYADRDAEHPLDIVQIDHTRLDMQIIDDLTGLTIDRPWVTLGIDVFSRLPWCLYVSFEPPSANVVRKAIQHGVFFKNTKQTYNTESEWAAFGIPNVIYVDNGMDFKSTDIKRLVNETLKSEIMHRPVRTPRYGAVIERLFGTINTELIHNLFGTTKSRFADLGEIDPENEACLTLNQIRTILTIYLTDMYPIRDHRGLPNYSKTPLNRYNDGCHNAGYPEWIDSSEEERYKIEFMLTIKKPYTRDGVRFGNRIYKSEECTDIIGTRQVKYLTKYDPDDISHIYLFHPKKEQFVELLCVSPSYEQLVGVNAYTYKKVLEIWNEEGEKKKQGIPGNDQYARAAKRIQDEVKNGMKNKKSIRKVMARMGKTTQIQVETAFKSMHNPYTSISKSRDEQLYLAAKEAEENWSDDDE